MTTERRNTRSSPVVSRTTLKSPDPVENQTSCIIEGEVKNENSSTINTSIVSETDTSREKHKKRKHNHSKGRKHKSCKKTKTEKVAELSSEIDPQETESKAQNDEELESTRVTKETVQDSTADQVPESSSFDNLKSTDFSTDPVRTCTVRSVVTNSELKESFESRSDDSGNQDSAKLGANIESRVSTDGVSNYSTIQPEAIKEDCSNASTSNSGRNDCSNESNNEKTKSSHWFEKPGKSNRSDFKVSKPKAPAFKIMHAGTGSWQHLDLDKPKNQSLSPQTCESSAKPANQNASEDVMLEPLTSYPPPKKLHPDNDYFVSQHANGDGTSKDSNDDAEELDISKYPSTRIVKANQGSLPLVVAQPPLPPPPPEEEQQFSEHFDLLLGFGLSEEAAKQVDLLFTCKYLTDPLPDDLILELAELEEEKVVALVESFKSADLSIIKNRLVFLKARLKLIKMKGVEALAKVSSNATPPHKPKVIDPQVVDSHQGGFIPNSSSVNSVTVNAVSSGSAEFQRIVSQVQQNAESLNIAQSQTYTYMASQKLADGSNQIPVQSPAQQPVSEIRAAPVPANSTDNSKTGTVAVNMYSYPPNPYQDMSSVQPQPETNGYPSNVGSHQSPYPSFNYYGSYNSGYGWGSSATPGTTSGAATGAQNGFSGTGYQNAPAYSGPSYRTGPDMSKMNEILLRTGYNYEHNHVIRKYGPPPDWVGDPPGSGHELFVSKIPTDCWEDEIIPIFEPIGKIYEVKILIDKETNLNKGFCFVCMCTKEDAKAAITRLSGSYIRQRCRVFVKYSVQFTRLFVGGIPRNKTREEIFSAFHDEVHNLSDVEVVGGDDGMQNRGFAFLDFKTYFDAAVAKKRLQAGKVSIRAWGRYSKFVVEWAVPLDNPDEEAKEQSRTILVKGLKSNTTEGEMYATFQGYGAINKVFKQQHYAFVEFMERESCLVAIEGEKRRGGYECRIHTPIPEVSKRMVQIIRERTAEKDALNGFNNASGFSNRNTSRLSGANAQPLVSSNQNAYSSSSNQNSSYDAYTRGYYDAQYRAHYDAYMNQATGGAPPGNYNYPPLTGYGSTASPTPANMPQQPPAPVQSASATPTVVTPMSGVSANSYTGTFVKSSGSENSSSAASQIPPGVSYQTTGGPTASSSLGRFTLL